MNGQLTYVAGGKVLSQDVVGRKFQLDQVPNHGPGRAVTGATFDFRLSRFFEGALIRGRYDYSITGYIYRDVEGMHR